MGRPRRDASDEETRSRLLRAAEKHFGQRGYRDARLEDIAKDAGIRRSSLLYYFESKEALYSLVVQAAFDELFSAVGRGLASDLPAEGQLEAVVRALLDVERAHRPLLRLVLQELIDARAETTARRQQLADLVGELARFVSTVNPALSARLPTRALVMHLVAAHLVHAAMGDDAMPLWGSEEPTLPIVRALLLPNVTNSASSPSS